MLSCWLWLAALININLAYGQDDFDLFILQCDNYPAPCNNDCYAVFTAGQPGRLNWNRDGRSSRNRRAAGCTPNPCCNANTGVNAPPNSPSCDEYPFASLVEGGAGAILRCTDYTQNFDEGRALGTYLSSAEGCGGAPCTFDVGMINFESSPFCINRGAANDGFQYTFTNGAYVPAKRDGVDRPVLHTPDPNVFFPPHKRREVLLQDGQRALLLTTNEYEPVEGRTVVVEKNGTLVRMGVDRELRGLEKSIPLRPLSVRNYRFKGDALE